jgi:hypothetical protein
MPLADRRAFGIERAALATQALFYLPPALQANVHPFVGDLYYLLAERLTDPHLTVESRLRLENHLLRLGEAVRFLKLDTVPPAPARRDVTALVREMDDRRPWVRWPATVEVGRARAAAVAPLRAALGTADEQTRLAAVLALRAIGPAASAAAPELIAQLRAANPELRRAVSAALASVLVRATATANAAALIAGLVPLLRDGDLDTRIAAATALAALRPGGARGGAGDCRATRQGGRRPAARRPARARADRSARR